MKFGRFPDLANEAPAGSQAGSGRKTTYRRYVTIQVVRKRISVLFKLYDSRGCVRDGKRINRRSSLRLPAITLSVPTAPGADGYPYEAPRSHAGGDSAHYNGATSLFLVARCTHARK
jgi:hypothetical protein